MNKFDRVLRAVLWPFFRNIVFMPGASYIEKLPQLTPEQEALRLELERHVHKLAVEIGDRSLERPQALEATAQYIFDCLSRPDYSPEIQPFSVAGQEQPGKNIIWEKLGTTYPEKILVFGAHYDTVPGTPGADDNATGVAAMLALAKFFANIDLPVTVRFVGFAREETSKYQEMGSYAYARRCFQRGEKIIGMVSLEMLGVYSDKPGSQKYPFPFSLFYPTQGDFIAFVGSSKSRAFVAKCVELFRKFNCFPCEGCAAPHWMTDAGRSDHKAFWVFGYDDAFMATDTSNFRYSLYHTQKDTPDKIDFGRFARVVHGLIRLIEALARN